MGSTPEASGLTTAHRVTQIQRAGLYAEAAGELWSALDVADLDASAPGWLLRNQQLVRAGHAESANLAASYVTAHREAEGVRGIAPVVRAELIPAASMTDLHINGPVAIKSAIARGISPDLAHVAVLERFKGAVFRQILDGGRYTISKTAQRDGGRWRRVTDGEPCAFCAMLAGRGPVYAADTVTFRSHNACGCSGEIVYREWVPTALERQWMASYMQAAMDADDAGQSRMAPVSGRDHEDTILWRMRRNSPHLFGDGVAPKTTP